MIKVDFDFELLSSLVKEAVKEVMAESHNESSAILGLPPIINKQQLQELLDISHAKASELINRSDFPVIRNMGHPRILTHKLFEWLEGHSDNENYIRNENITRLEAMKRRVVS